MHPYPESETSAVSAEAILNAHIVVLKSDVDESHFENHVQSVMRHHSERIRASRTEGPSPCGVRERYSVGRFRSYSGTFHPDTLEHIKNSPEVDFVEQDQGLARISNKTKKDLSKYYYPASAGKGVTVYVIDTGINTKHKEFGGRATWGANIVDTKDVDDNGHGTHVSGTIGGATNGLAKKASLIAVKVLGGKEGSGSASGVIQGIQWATSNAREKGISTKSVANMSLGGGFSLALNKAVNAASATDITFVVASGNDGVDASTCSPASAQSAITVGASDIKDITHERSNFGPSVDILAPGVNITSAWIGSDTATKTISGTSMATPHVVGLAACLIAEEGISGSSKVAARIKSLATRGAVTNPPPKTTSSLAYDNSGK